MHHWKRLLPPQLARINVNDDLLIVVPAIDRKTSFEVQVAVKDTMNAFESVIGRSSPGLYGSARSDHIDHLKARHIITRERDTCHEFSVRVRNYPAESDIFITHDPMAMCNDYFWKRVRKPKNVGTAIDKQKELMSFTPHEQKVWERYCKPEVMRNDYDELEEEGKDDDDAVSCVSSCAESLSSRTGNANLDDIEMTNSPSELEAWQQLSEESKIEEATEGLKYLGNMKRKGF